MAEYTFLKKNSFNKDAKQICCWWMQTFQFLNFYSVAVAYTISFSFRNLKSNLDSK